MNPTWHIEVPARGAARVSVPLPRGTQVDAIDIRPVDRGPRDAAFAGTAIQWRPIVHWADGSVRWLQIDFRAGQAGAHVVTLNPPTPAPTTQADAGDSLLCSHDAKTAQVRCGDLVLELHPHADRGMLDVQWNERSLFGEAGGLRFVVRDRDGNSCPIAHESVRDFAVEASGPMRFQASWWAEHRGADGERLLDARFRIEMLSGAEPGIALSYQFFHMLPGQDMLDVASVTASIDMPWLADDGDADTALLQQAYGDAWVRRVVRTKSPVAVRFDRTRKEPYVTDVSVLEDDTDYPYFLEGGNQSVSDSVVLCGGDVAVGFQQREFMSHRPKELRTAPGRIDLDVWPDWAGPMRLPQGRSARQTLCMRFAKADAVDRLLTTAGACDPQPAHAWLARDDSAFAGATWDPQRTFTGSEPGAAVFSHLLKSGTSRWRTVGDMFDHGDCPDTGYMRTYTGGKDRYGAPRPMPEYTFADDGSPHDLFHAADELAVVWTNNEYDVIYCLALEAMRTRDLSAWRKMTAAARHQLEVDFVHYSDHPRHHRSTPAHSYNHVTGAATIASHQWTQGLYHYYCLTGDDDVPEVVRAICDYNIRFIESDAAALDIGFNRELGWALIALCFGHEMLGDAKYLDAARTIVDRIVDEAARTDFSREAALKGKGVGLTLSMLGTNFNVNTIPLGLKHFHQITGDDKVLKVLMDWTTLGMVNFNNRGTGVKLTELWTETFCYLCEMSGDSTWLEASLWQLSLFFRGFNALGWVPPGNDTLTTKAYCRVYRGLVHYLSALAKAGMLPRAEAMVLNLPE